MKASFFIEKIGVERIDQAFAGLEKPLKDMFDGEMGGNLVSSVIDKYEADSFFLPDLMLVIGFYVACLINNQEMVDYLGLIVPEKYFPQFMQELEDKLWSPYDVYLNKAGVVYKQLTKLTPQPVISNELSVEKVPQGQAFDNSKQPVSALSVGVQSDNVVVNTPNLSAPTLKEVVISDLASPKTEIIGGVVAPAGQKTIPQQSNESRFATGQNSGTARVKFDAPRVGPEILKPTASEIKPSFQEVRFKEPEKRPEVGGNVSATGSAWQGQEEKKIEIPKAQEIKKTEIQGRQVIDLTNFGLSKPDSD